MLFTIINRFTCNHNQLSKMIQKINNTSSLPIIDYICENPKKYNINYRIIKNNILQYPNNVFAVKLSSLNVNEDKDNSYKLLDNLCNYAYKNNSKIMIDAEDYLIQKDIDYISNVMMEKYNKKKVIIYKTYQMYRKDSLYKLNRDLLCSRNYHLGVKIVRGAYYNQDKSYNILFDTIDQTHKNYNQGIISCLKYSKNNDKIVFASHNDDSIKYVIEKNKVFKKYNISFAQLMGMDHKNKQYIINNKYVFYTYLPYGDFKESIPYLIRRLYENYPLISKIIK